MSRPAWAIVVTIMVACVTVDYLNRNVDPNGPPAPSALMYGIALSLMVCGIDSMVRKRRRRRSARAEEHSER